MDVNIQHPGATICTECSGSRYTWRADLQKDVLCETCFGIGMTVETTETEMSSLVCGTNMTSNRKIKIPVREEQKIKDAWVFFVFDRTLYQLHLLDLVVSGLLTLFVPEIQVHVFLYRDKISGLLSSPHPTAKPLKYRIITYPPDELLRI